MLLTIALLSAIAGVFYFGWTAWVVGERMKDSEIRSAAMQHVSRWVTEYVEANDGHWPRSWANLQTVPEPVNTPYKLAGDLVRLQELVTIDFEADVDRLVTLSTDEFDGIRPNGTIYPVFRDYAFGPLLDVLRRYAADNVANSLEP